MGEMVFNQQCLSKLAQIRREMEKEFGYSYQLSSDAHLVDLLRAATYTQDQKIQQCFHDFLQGLDVTKDPRVFDVTVSSPHS